MGAYLCTVSRESPGNWPLCKQVGLWGIPSRNARRLTVEVGDRLLIWMGGRGYVAEAIVTERPRPPRSRDEAPWPGGTDRFDLVVPMKVDTEVQTPIYLPFVGDRQSETDLSKSVFRRSFFLLPEVVADRLSKALASRASEEQDSTASAGN